jgi:hypothetical protein
MKSLRDHWQRLLRRKATPGALEPIPDVGIEAVPGELPPTNGPPEPSDVEKLLEQLDGRGAAADSPRAVKAREALQKREFRRAADLLARIAETSDEANLLGLAYAHLAFELREGGHWQQAANAFAFAAEVSGASDRAVERAKANRAAVEQFFAIRAEPKL